jgi:exodeoxyribonuclease VII large subunit
MVAGRGGDADPRDAPPRRALVRSGGSWQLAAPTEDAYSVSQVNALARRLLETSLPPFWVRGEVTSWKRHGSGHCYFSLRDANAQLRSVMFRLDAMRLPTDPDEGMEVLALGTLTLYEKRGEYQFVVRDLQGRGAGGLWRLAFEKLRAKLDSEGLLAPERKRLLPRHPTVVGVVTSPVGAALQDIIEVIRARAPWTHVLLSPARVPGEGAAQDVARAIHRFTRVPADVVIVGRGGGSAEDLWAFNEEVVARAIAACPAPVISAVGHEVDVTIADLVADVRAPTPSAAAERAVPDGASLRRELQSDRLRMRHGLRSLARARAVQLAGSRDALEAAMQGSLEARRERLVTRTHRLDALSPLAALRRGFAVPLGEDGRILRATEDFETGRAVRLRVSDGHVHVRTERTSPLEGEGS